MTASCEVLAHGLTIHSLTFCDDSQATSNLDAPIPSTSPSYQSQDSTLSTKQQTVPKSRNLDLLVGPSDPLHHQSARAFINSTVGRYANRLPSQLEFGDTILNLPSNDGEGVCLHGGVDGLDTKTWNKLEQSDSELFKEDKFEGNDFTIYSITSEAGENGFPLKLLVEASVSLYSTEEIAAVLTIVLRARIVEDGTDLSSGTPVNLCIHWGFRTNDEERDDILGHKLFVDVSKLLNLTFLLSKSNLSSHQPLSLSIRRC